MINVNTASIDDLMTLEGIGAQRAAAIIELRDEKGYITMNDIEDNLHNTTLLPWDNTMTSTIQKLLNDEVISFEIPPTLVDSIMEKQDGEHKKAMDNVTKEFGLKLDQVHEHYRTMQRNYEEEMNRMTKKRGELEKKLSEKKVRIINHWRNC
jgi:hypothetical protein